MAKANVVFGSAGQFKIERTDKAGKVTSDSFEGNKMLEVAQTVRLVTGAVKGQQTMSDAWQSLIVRVLSDKGLDGYKGKGDKETGKTSTTFKDQIRKSEDAYFDQLALDKVPGIPQDVEKRNEMVRAMRNDNNYSNIRSTCAKYFAFIGAIPATESGYLIPRPVMLAQIAGVLNIKPEDTSLKGRIDALVPGVKSNDDVKALKAAMVSAQHLIDQLKLRIDHHAEVNTNAAQHMPPIPSATKAVIDSAMKQAEQAEQAIAKRKARNAAKTATSAPVKSMADIGALVK